MIRFLERNGYDVSYVAGVDAQTRGPLLKNHKLFISSGHDEYWSAQQRANVEAARDAGVNLAFFSGNEVFWKTRFEPSQAGTSTPNRTLVSYKDTHFDAAPGPGGVDRHVARPALDDARRERHAGELADRPVVRRELGHVPHHGAVGVSPAPHVAQHDASPRRRPDRPLQLAPSTLGYEWDADAGQRLPAGGLVPALVDDRQRSRGVHRLRQHDQLQRHGHAQHDDVPRAQRRARVRRRHRAVGVGPGRRQRGRHGRGPQHAAGDGEPVRRHGRTAGHAHVHAGRRNRVHGHHRAHVDDHAPPRPRSPTAPR